MHSSETALTMRPDTFPARLSLPDPELIAAVASGDPQAMRALFQRHKVRVFRFVLRLVGEEAVAEEIVADVFLEVWRQAGRFGGRSRVSTWMLAIARYKALSARRHVRATVDEAAAEVIADEADTPEDAVLRADQSAHLRACLQQLSPEHREIIDLVYYHGRSVEEVSEITKAPKNTVKTRMFYARKQLGRLLADAERPAATAAA